MKKLTIQFDGYEIGDCSSFCGFENSKDMVFAVANNEINPRMEKNGGMHFECEELELGDILFDYETGTRWKVVEAK